MRNVKAIYSILIIGFASLFLMGCPNNNNKNSNIPELGSYGDRSQVIFAGSSFSQPYIEQVNMPYAIAELGNVYGQLKMNLYFYESDVSAGGNPCFNLNNNIIHNQTYQRSFIVRNVDFASRQPQLIFGGNGSNTGFFNNVPSVYFQMTDRSRNLSMIEYSFNGQVTVLESTYEGALLRFDNVISTTNCYRTPENQMYACGARLSGQVRVAFCR